MVTAARGVRAGLSPGLEGFGGAAPPSLNLSRSAHFACERLSPCQAVWPRTTWGIQHRFAIADPHAQPEAPPEQDGTELVMSPSRSCQMRLPPYKIFLRTQAQSGRLE